MTEGLSFLCRLPLPSTTRPASLPTVLGPQQAVGERAGGKPCAPPWPIMPRSVPSSISTWAGGSQASVVGLVPAPLCTVPSLPTLRRGEPTDSSPVAPVSGALGLLPRGLEGGALPPPPPPPHPTGTSQPSPGPQSVCALEASCTQTAPRPAHPAAPRWLREGRGPAGKRA